MCRFGAWIEDLEGNKFSHYQLDVVETQYESTVTNASDKWGSLDGSKAPHVHAAALKTMSDTKTSVEVCSSPSNMLHHRLGGTCDWPERAGIKMHNDPSFTHRADHTGYQH